MALDCFCGIQAVAHCTLHPDQPVCEQHKTGCQRCAEERASGAGETADLDEVDGAETKRSGTQHAAPADEAPTAPSGTVTFVFTDIVGSTVAWERDRAAMEAAVARHDELLRSVFEGAGGYVFALGGDAFAVAFSKAEDAIDAAASAQRAITSELWPDGVELSIRVGVHTGEPRERAGNYYGPVVNRAARVMGAALGDQILVSEAAQLVAGGALPAGVALLEASELTLRGLSEPIRASVLAVDGVEGPLRPSRGSRRGNLPVHVEELVGRADAEAEVRSAIASHAVVTIVGAAGVGKTSLAQHVGSVVSGFDGGVWFVHLAQISDPDDVADAVAQVVGVAPSPHQTVVSALADVLRRQPTLLILDNCEHLVKGVAEVAETLIRSVTDLRIIATSREPLHITGEQVIPIRPLGSDGPESDAVALFVRRASEAHAGFDPLDQREALSTLCHRLDGLPLAIELAAARMRSLRPSEVLEHLDERFRLLTHGRRTATERHQTLRAAVGWSYDLLDPAEQRVLDRVSVFAGRFSLDDAAAVAEDDTTSRLDVVDHIGQLADRSMIETFDDEPRFGLLETIRAFARERLEAGGDADHTEHLHAVHFRTVARRTLDRCVGPSSAEELRTVRLRLADHHQAVQWAVADGDVDLAVESVVDLGVACVCWNMRDPAGWLESLVDHPPHPLPAEWPAFLCLVANRAYHRHGDLRRAMELLDRATALNPDDPLALETAASFDIHSGRFDAALRRLDTASEESTRGRPMSLDVWCTMYRVLALIGLHRTDEALDAIDGLDRWADRTGSPTVRAIASLAAGTLGLQQDDPRARAHLQEAVRVAERCESAVELLARIHLANALTDVDASAAAIEYAELLDLASRRNTELHAATYRNVAAVLAAHGEDRSAARLVGLAGDLRPRDAAEPDATGSVMARAVEGERFGVLDSELRDRLGPDFDRLTAPGRDYAAAAAFARKELARVVAVDDFVPR